MACDFTIDIQENVALISLGDCPSGAAFLADVLRRIAETGTDVDMIALAPGSSGRAALSFTVSDDDFARVLGVTGSLQKENPALKVSVSNGYAKITVGGEPMDGAPGVAAKVFAAIKNAADLRMVTTALTEISLLVPVSDGRIHWRHCAEASRREPIFACAVL
ncbi:MAG: hypothetical protein LBT21_03825 [Oscillospiraceae bacterium]|jgi:aspartate kinase|nr:hypothetical protein [Oscillospiraceae bacterium]